MTRNNAHTEEDLALSNLERINKWGHRKYIGAPSDELWHGIGRRQFHFLVSQGLRPHHKFLDIACGSLRLGQFLIPFLEPNRYFGLDGEQSLVMAGLEHEILFDLASLKSPKFQFGYDFDVSFASGFDYAMAQSLFTHLTLDDISLCLRNTRQVSASNSRFYFTFFEGSEDRNPTGNSHANQNWAYTMETLRDASKDAGWKFHYIGDWGHERGQMMAYVTPR